MASRQNDTLPTRLSARSYFEIAVSFLMLFLGAVIFLRSVTGTGLIMGMGIGLAFSAYGIYRIRHIWNYFSGKARP